MDRLNLATTKPIRIFAALYFSSSTVTTVSFVVNLPKNAAFYYFFAAKKATHSTGKMLIQLGALVLEVRVGLLRKHVCPFSFVYGAASAVPLK